MERTDRTSWHHRVTSQDFLDGKNPQKTKIVWGRCWFFSARPQALGGGNLQVSPICNLQPCTLMPASQHVHNKARDGVPCRCSSRVWWRRKRKEEGWKNLDIHAVPAPKQAAKRYARWKKFRKQINMQAKRCVKCTGPAVTCIKVGLGNRSRAALRAAPPSLMSLLERVNVCPGAAFLSYHSLPT